MDPGQEIPFPHRLYCFEDPEHHLRKLWAKGWPPEGQAMRLDDLIQTINEMIGRLEASFKRMAEFTADTSHELRTPLCAMRGEAEVLLLKPRTADEYQEALVHFIEEFDRLNQMISDLILLSKFDAAQMELKRVPLRLDLLIEGMGEFFQALAEQKGLTLEVEAPEEVTVLGDKVRLQQLFTNLIDNAIKYTPEGSIRILSRERGETVLVRVKDTGIGISKEEQERSSSASTGSINPVKGDRRGRPGTEYCRMDRPGPSRKDGGRKRVESGTTFTVYLPVSRGDQ